METDDEITKRRKAKAPPDPVMDPVMAMVKETIAKAMKTAADQRAEEKAMRREVGRIADALTVIAAAVLRESKRKPRVI